jgi:serine/threonine-protein kinase
MMQSDAADIRADIPRRRQPLLPDLPQRLDGSSSPTILADRWRLDVQIGQGAFGKVWRARDMASGEQVAIKLFNTGLEATGYLQELGLLFSEAHPHIVYVHSFGYSKGQRYIVYEYVHGGSLRDLLVSQPRIEPLHALSITRDIVEGLRFAHARDVVHRDLKPENILLTSSKLPTRAKLCDFGLAARSRAGERLTSRYGSPGYMAPEQFEGDYDRRVDLWAVGVILYEMLFGRRPFDGDPVSIRHAHRHAEVPYPDDAPPALLKLLGGLLARDPAARYADAGALLADLDAAQAAMTRPRRQPTISQPLFREVTLERRSRAQVPGRALGAVMTERGELLLATEHGVELVMEDGRCAQLVKTAQPIDALIEGGHMGHAIGWIALGKLWAFERGQIRQIVGDYTLPERSRRVLWTPGAQHLLIHSTDRLELVDRVGRVCWRAQIASYGVVPPLCVSEDGQVLWIAQEAPRTQLVALSLSGRRLVRTAAGGADVAIAPADGTAVLVGTRGQRQLMRVDLHGFVTAQIELTEPLQELHRMGHGLVAATSARHLQLLDVRTLRSRAMVALPSLSQSPMFGRSTLLLLAGHERHVQIDIYKLTHLDEVKTP